MASPSTLSQIYMKMDHMDEVGNLHNMNNNMDEIGKTYPTNDHMDETLITSHKSSKLFNTFSNRFIEFQ
jgi:hypothetical protein